MKKPYVIFLVALVAAVVFLTVFLIWKHIQNSILDRDGMENNMNISYIYFLEGGGMRGGQTELHAKYDEESGLILVNGTTKEQWNEPDEIIEYKADIGLFTEIEKTVREARLAAAARKRYSRDIVHDAASWDLTIEYQNGREIRIDSLRTLSYEDNQACRRIVEMIQNGEYKIEE